MNFIENSARTLLHQIRRSFGSLPGSKLKFRKIKTKNSNLTAEQISSWNKNGFLVLPGFIQDELVHRINEQVETLWKNSRESSSPLTVDIFLGKNEKRIKLHDAPFHAKQQPYKLNDLYLVSENVRDAVISSNLAWILSDLLCGEPIVCNSLNFEFGSEQPYHTDSLYMTPPRALNLVATWIALEDCTEDAGPLRYYPGSHKIPPYKFSNGSITAITSEMSDYCKYMDYEVRRRGLKEEVFCAKKGDLFIWHSQLFHGGSSIKNPSKTRKSLVTHYYRRSDIGGIHVQHGQYGAYMDRPHQPVSNN